jgi:hypothetical protein
VNKSFQDWLAEGEQIYDQTLKECRALEAQLEDLEMRLAAKREELNHLGQVMGKQPSAFGPAPTSTTTGAASASAGSARALTAELLDSGAPRSVPNSPSSIARALTGRGIGRYVPPPPPTTNAM